MANGSYSTWRLVSCGVLQEFVLSDSFINVLEEEVEYVLFNADYHKLGNAVNTFKGRADIQRDLDWLEE